MIEHATALELVAEHAKTLPVVLYPLQEATGLVLAETVHSPYDHPFFDQSAMDGYAIRHSDLGNALILVGEVPAGGFATKALETGEAYRIFTGAAIPDGADTVIMQEHAQTKGPTVSFTEQTAPKGANIRYKGEQIKKEAIALEQGTLLTAAAIGFLGSIGVTEVNCYRKPTIAIVTTGSEFATTAEDLGKGKIMESNGAMLLAGVHTHFFEAKTVQVPDDKAALTEAFAALAKEFDVLVTTGGVSVGKYDYTQECLAAVGFEKVFHKVNQKPGKPLLFMRSGNKLVFGLPGNPRAALIGLHVYVLPALQRMAGNVSGIAVPATAQLNTDLAKKDDKTHFNSFRWVNGKLDVVHGRGSHLLQDLVSSDGIVVFDGLKGKRNAGTEMNYYSIRF